MKFSKIILLIASLSLMTTSAYGFGPQRNKADQPLVLDFDQLDQKDLKARGPMDAAAANAKMLEITGSTESARSFSAFIGADKEGLYPTIEDAVQLGQANAAQVGSFDYIAIPANSSAICTKDKTYLVNARIYGMGQASIAYFTAANDSYFRADGFFGPSVKLSSLFKTTGDLLTNLSNLDMNTESGKAKAIDAVIISKLYISYQKMAQGGAQREAYLKKATQVFKEVCSNDELLMEELVALVANPELSKAITFYTQLAGGMPAGTPDLLVTQEEQQQANKEQEALEEEVHAGIKATYDQKLMGTLEAPANGRVISLYASQDGKVHLTKESADASGTPYSTFNLLYYSDAESKLCTSGYTYFIDYTAVNPQAPAVVLVQQTESLNLDGANAKEVFQSATETIEPETLFAESQLVKTIEGELVAAKRDSFEGDAEKNNKAFAGMMLTGLQMFQMGLVTNNQNLMSYGASVENVCSNAQFRMDAFITPAQPQQVNGAAAPAAGGPGAQVGGN